MPASARAARLDSAVRAAAARPLLWVGAVLLLAAWPVVWALRTDVPPPPPVLGEVPAFELVDQDGRAFGSADLSGRIWVASFIFTRCPTVCPAITRQMERVQERTRSLEPALHLVSFSVDPEHDTPARLAAYAREHRANPRRWRFLTGSTDAVRETVERGLRVSMGREGGDPSPAAISHGTHLVLIDSSARIRGYYDPAEPDALDRLVRDAALLANRG
ncbi:SCO family protein [Anaeromyxobacter sp. Fw109-5]|uniref:SCO family protein n=1 Tax=Anaeromyxobacter sp. (strain Fw109-5) TaxID=404589 RepID=UPI0000ED813D|nr:SCO family protein [Anaeromyxobacter sp. Fw109-5]ABS27065.1 electron transport protein SCO1/SenC [Anaeromyxobacter sp. Fw109-5]